MFAEIACGCGTCYQYIVEFVSLSPANVTICSPLALSAHLGTRARHALSYTLTPSRTHSDSDAPPVRPLVLVSSSAALQLDAAPLSLRLRVSRHVSVRTVDAAAAVGRIRGVAGV